MTISLSFSNNNEQANYGLLQNVSPQVLITFEVKGCSAIVSNIQRASTLAENQLVKVDASQLIFYTQPYTTDNANCPIEATSATNPVYAPLRTSISSTAISENA